MLLTHRLTLSMPLVRSGCGRLSWQSTRTRGTCCPSLTVAALCASHRYQSSPGPTNDDTRASGPQVALTSRTAKVKYEEVWQLWNEGNLFSLHVAQMRDFLADVGIIVDPTAKKAAVVRRMEAYLHDKDSSEQHGGAAAAVGAAKGAGKEGEQGYGNWAGAGATQPETLLDLAQAGFYQGTANMVPKAFQLLTTGSCAEAVVSRVNTSTFPGFPANTECYTLSSSDATGALQTRYSKVLQWCLLNMNNLRMDGELTVELGKLLLTPAAMRYGEAVVSVYTLQQRLQLTKPYTWVSTAPESAIPLVDAFLTERGFQPVRKNARLTYEGGIKRAKDKLEVVLNDQMKVEGVYGEWVDVQTAFCTSVEKPDCRILLRSRPAVSAQDRETYTRIPVIELADDDVNDVLPPENGQLVYLSENETRHFERLNDKGIAIAVRETKRQPLIVLRDEEEDPRLEYQISVTIPASAGSHTMDVRAVGLEVLTLADEMSTLLKEPFNEAYRGPSPIFTTTRTVRVLRREFTLCVLLRGMPLISSTASKESCGAVDSVHLIRSICALDDHTLVFAIATTACANSAAGGSFGAVRFSLREASDDAAKEKSCGPRPLSCDTSPTGVLRYALYARSLKASRGADFSSSAHEECNEYPECCSGADSAGGVGNSLTMPTLGSHSRQSCLPLERAAPAWAATVASLSERSRDSLAVLRALQVSPSLHLCGAASKEPPAGTPPTSFQPSPSHVSGDALVALHVVRQEAWQCSPDAASTATQFTISHNASSATLLSTDVLCYFDCGCAALATFKLTRRLPASEWSVQLSECVWIPSATSPRSAPSRGGGTVKGRTSLSTYETGVPLVSSLVRPLPTTASLATCADDNHDGRNSLELLVVWCSPTVASSSSGFSLLPCTRPVARYTSLRCCCRAPATTSTVEREWRLHSQAIFDMSELLNVAPSASLSSKGVHDCASLCNVLPHSSVRSLSWLPGTADFTQSYPLLAVLYAAPTVQACHVNSVGGAPTELCLDSLAVCYLKEDGHNLNAVTTPHKTPPMVTGRLLVGPWSVRGLSLAHPQFLFATALAGLRSPLSHPPLAMNARFAAGPVASASPSAAQVFRATLHTSADEAAAVLGVFQRPVQEPYAPSSVFRSVATTISRRRYGGKAMAGTPLANGNMARLRELSQLQHAGGEPDNLSAPRNSKVFAFVLYGSEGEVARCVLDGYIEDAQTTWLAPRIMPAHKDGNSRATGDVLGRGDEGVSRTVAHVCALLSEKPSTLSAAKVHWHSAVVIAIQAQWTRAPPMVAERWHENEPFSRSRSSAGDHWSFSVQVTQRLRSSGVPGGVLSRPWCATPLTMVGRILCWRSAAADCDTTSGDVSCLVCGYATIPHHGGTASSVVDASDNILLEGVFELWLSASVMSSSDDGSGRPATVTPATNATLGIEQRRGTETSSAAASLPQSTAGLCPWAVGSCTRVASPSAFSAVLHNASTTDTLATAFDLLSHTPTFLVSAARFGSTVSDGVVPVALAWVGGGVEADIDNLARAAPSLSGATTPSKASLLSCVRQLDAVALLRSGDVVGWRCTSSFSAAATAAGIPSGEGVVLHLGVIWRGLAHGTTQPLNELFCKLLLGSGTGADAVHMEVVTSPMEDKSRRVDHLQAGVGESAMEGRSSSSASLVAEMAAKGTVLLVLAVGSLVGVVDLAAEAVVFVRDLRADLPGISEREGDTIGRRAASPATADGATTLVTASVLRLQRLPVVTPCGWMAAGEVAQQGAGAAVGESWYFVWSGATEPQGGHSSLAFVLRLSFLRWVDVVSAHVGTASNSAAGGAAPTASVFDTEPSPAPLVTLQVDVRLQGEAKPPGYSAAVSSVSPPPPSHHLSVSRSCSSATAYIGWLSCPTGCADDGVGCAAPRGTTANVEAAASSGDTAGYLPLLSVCDAALLRSLWPTMSTDEIKMSMSQNCASSLPGAVVPRHRPPLRLFRWGGVVLQPSIPSSLLLHHQIGAACVMEQLARGGATTRLGMPLHVVHRSLLGESHDANTTLTPPEKGRGVDLLCGLTCRQVLYVSTLTLDVRADGGRCDEHEPVLQERTVSCSPSPAVHGAQPVCSSSDPTPWHVLLCTMLLNKGEQTSRSKESAETFSGTSASFDVGAASATAMRIDRGEGQVASYLLCGLPARVSAVPPQQKPSAAAVTHPSPLFTWHWIPLHVATSFPAPRDCGSVGMAPAGIVSTGSGGVEQNLAPLAITRVLPLPSRKRFSPAALPPTHAATVSAKSVPHAVAPGSYFYCEGMLSDPAVPGAPHGEQASYYLIVQGGRLRRFLERSAAAAAALTDDFEHVYMYTTVDPDLVRVVDTSLASHVRVPR